MKSLGKKIRLLRHQHGWSQEEVAKRLDISIPAFSKIETGITDVNISRLEQISSLFKIEVSELLSFGENGKPGRSEHGLEELYKQLQEKDKQVIELQQKVIELYEELRKSEHVRNNSTDSIY